MKSRLATIVLAIAIVFTSSCATLGRFSPGYDSFEQGLALFNQGRFSAAEPYFERATRQNPDFAEAYFYLGRTYISQSKWRAAIQPLRTAFRLSPREAQQEIMDLILDATFAAALNDFKLGEERRPPARFDSTL
ncbi:MAG TPA: tetratricopeptide repeat protein [Verrucomicrobiae bacterium]|nr:tetratricopeptide repeat protein [Verrucomicrobiae bacterium]